VITNLARIRSVPFVLAWLVGALAVLTVVHVMVTSVRNRRREVAVLRSMGADGGWLTRAVHWQATTFSLAPLVLGAPLGLIVGRLLFQAFADAVGTVPDASFPYALLAAVTAGIVALANAVAAVPAHRARRLAPAPLLTGE
jgi:ABC-type lipoprotein release transport system permease subunit